MEEQALAGYVKSALALQGYALRPEVEREIVQQFVRIQAMAATFADLDLPVELEPAPVFRP